MCFSKSISVTTQAESSHNLIMVIMLLFFFLSLWPTTCSTDTKGRHGTGWTLAQVMACCLIMLMAPSQMLSEPVLTYHHIDGLVQDCSNCSALVMGSLQSCTKPSIFVSCGIHQWPGSNFMWSADQARGFGSSKVNVLHVLGNWLIGTCCKTSSSWYLPVLDLLSKVIGTYLYLKTNVLDTWSLNFKVSLLFWQMTIEDNIIICGSQWCCANTSFAMVMAWCQLGNKLLPEPMMEKKYEVMWFQILSTVLGRLGRKVHNGCLHAK